MFKKFFTRKKVARIDPSAPIAVPDDDIPRYPPFAKGLPAAPATRIIQTQQDLIARIRGSLRLNNDEFVEIAMPVIERYAAYVHLLPASEAHHHRGAGGLFRHGLEVGFWASQRAESHQFCLGETPQSLRDNEPRWQFAAFLGGLLHDVGKPLSDVAVTDSTGKKEWNPYSSSLAEWVNDESIENYFLRWRDKRNKRHEKFSMMNLDQIITPKARSYLNKPGPHIMEALLEALVGMSVSESLSQIVLWADQESVRRDLVKQRLNIDEYAYGVPVERFVFDALRRIVCTCKINEPGACIWRVEQSVFLVWNQVVPLIHQHLDQDKIPGVPRNPDTLADILIERGFATPFQESPESKPMRYWRLYPEPLNGIPLVMVLRIDDFELIFTGEPPSSVKASLVAPPPKQENKAEQEQNEQEQNEKKPRQEYAAPDEYVSWEQIHSELDVAPQDVNPIDTKKPSNPAPVSLMQVEKPQKQAELAEEKPEEQKNRVAIERMKMFAGQVDSQAIMGVKIKKQPVAEKQEKDEKNVYGSMAEAHDKTPEQAAAWALLDKAIAMSTSKRKNIERLPDGDYGIPYPASAAQLGTPKDVMTCFYAGGLLRIDQTATSKTTTISGNKYLVFNRKYNRQIEALLNESAAKVGTQEKEKTQPSDDMPTALIEQMMRGFGPFLVGDVAIEQVEGGTKYSVSIKTVDVIAKAITVNTNAVAARLRSKKNITLTKTDIEYLDGI